MKHVFCNLSCDGPFAVVFQVARINTLVQRHHKIHHAYALHSLIFLEGSFRVICTSEEDPAY